MREKLIKAVELVREREALERLQEMTDEQIEDWIAASLGLPAGTKFTDEQLEMMLRSYPSPEGAGN